MRSIEHLSITNFRNIEQASLELHPQLNLFCGPNGSGKTSVLEAINVCGLARSFRAKNLKKCISFGSHEFTLFSKCQLDGEVTKVGLSKAVDDELRIRVNGENLSRTSSLAKLIPLQMYEPNSVELVIGPPELRRSFLDWVLFHVEHSFSHCWSNFQKLLANRNALLRSRRASKSEFDYWDEQLIHSASKIDEMRREWIVKLAKQFNETSVEYDNMLEAVGFKYRSGWDSQNFDLKDSLVRNWELDIERGFTSVGPQRAEIAVTTNGRIAKEVLSRGRLKLLALLMKISATELVSKEASTNIVFLLDDLTAELDEATQQKVLKQLVDTKSQVFLTSLEYGCFINNENKNNYKMFHVEHGKITY